MGTRCTKKTKTKSAMLPTSLMSFFINKCISGPVPFFEGSCSVSVHLGLLHRPSSLQEEGRLPWAIQGGGGEEEILPASEEADSDQRAQRTRIDGRRQDGWSEEGHQERLAGMDEGKRRSAANQKLEYYSRNRWGWRHPASLKLIKRQDKLRSMINKPLNVK